MLIRFESCSHPESKRQDVGDPTGYSCSVAVEPFTDENRAAHGNIRQTVECSACGGRRDENRNQWHLEVSPWRDHRTEIENERRKATRLAIEQRKTAQAEEERRVALVQKIETAYGTRAQIIETADLCLLRYQRPGHADGNLEIVIGTNLADAARRTKTPDARQIREAINSEGLHA